MKGGYRLPKKATRQAVSKSLLLMLVLAGCSFSQHVSVPKRTSGNTRFVSAPVLYDDTFQTEFERNGYQLSVVPHPVAFSPDGRAYVRQRHGVAYVNPQGAWSYFSFISVISKAAGGTCSGVDMFMRNDLRIVFDRDGYAYTPVIADVGKSKQGFLLTKSPDSEEWSAYSLPAGDVRMEWFSGARQLAGPPAILIFRDETVFLIDATRNGDRISLSKPEKVADNVLAIARLGSGGSVVVRSGTMINTVFALRIAPDGMAGTPEMFAAWSPEHKTKCAPRLLGMSPVYQSPSPDPHDVPVMVSDSKGILHAVLGAHNRPFQYMHTVKTDDPAQIKWTMPTVIRNSKDGREAWNLTYPELVCDSKDTLHLVARRWTREKGQFLVYLRKELGEEWTSPKELVVPQHGGYFNSYHRLMKDSQDRLFLTWYAYFNHFTDSQKKAYQKKHPNEKLTRAGAQGFGRYNYEGVKRHGPYLLVSDDRGKSWRMAVNEDFEIKLPSNQTEAE